MTSRARSSHRLSPSGFLATASLMAVLAGCGPQASPPGSGTAAAGAGGKLTTLARQDADAFTAVDCKLPAQLRKLGRQVTFLASQRVVKTSAGDCEIRGGEYIAYDRADLGTALSFWMPDAQAGDPKAQTYVGELFERGIGGAAPDHASAAVWYRRAAEQGYAPAQINLGQLYEQGRGVERDTVEALNWYRRASGLGVTFVASGDIAGELTSLREQVSERDRELEGLRGELRRVQDLLERERTRRAESQATGEAERRRIEAARRELEAERQALAEARRELLPDAPELAAERERLAARADELARLETSLSTWQQQVAARDAALSQRERDEAALEAELELARRQLAETREALAAKEAALSRERQELERTGVQGTEREQRLAAREAELDRLAQLLTARQTEIGARQAELEALESGLSDQALAQGQKVEEALARVREQLEAGQAALTGERERLTRLESELRAKEESFARKSAEAEAQLAALREREAEIARQAETLAEREQSLSEREAEVTRLDAQISQLNQQAQTQLAALTELLNKGGSAAAPSEEVATGPVISLLDPSIEQPTRSGVPLVPVRSGIERRMIVGQITAPAGMASLTLNGRKESWNDQGVFAADVPLAPDGLTEVEIVAVDAAGRRGALRFALQPAAPQGETVTAALETGEPLSLPKLDPVGLELGRFHALVIGNNDYSHLPKLTTAHNDAKAVAAVLGARYGFEVKLLLDADRYELLSALNELRATLTENDNLLIYYAGHGTLDELNQRGHWLPVDAEATNTANWISNVEISDTLNAMNAKRVMVVADSCYSGTLTRSTLARLQTGMSPEARRTWLLTLAEKRARVALTSGGLTPVLDQGGGEHSIFARAFLDALEKNADILEGQRLHQLVSISVTYAADAVRFEQVPEYAPIKYAGHESGEFFFVPRS